MIPFVDLKAQYLSIKEEIDNEIQNVIDKTSFVGGPEVTYFEKSFAKWLGIKYFIGTGNGTDSLEILLKAMNIGQGDEVIVPAISWISTSEAVSNVGATAVFVDIQEDIYTMDVSKIEIAITSHTKAIIPVHLYGQSCDMTTIMKLSKKYNLKILEDCAQAHGAMWNGQKVGTFGLASSFSFYPGKNLGAYGDGGGIATNNEEIAAKARMLGNHGQLKKHEHQIEGRNSRLDTIQAAILNVKLKYLDEWNSKRNQVANWYLENLINSAIICPKIQNNASHVFHLFVIRSKNRQELQVDLSKSEIQSAIHYPNALPFLPCYKDRNFKREDFPVAAMVQNEILSLPMYPELTKDMVLSVCSIINKL